MRPAANGRRRVLEPPRPRACACEGRPAERGHGGADGPKRRPLPGPRRLDAPRRRRARAARRNGRGRRQHPARARQRARPADPRRRHGRGRLLRRRRGAERHLRRVRQPRHALAAAGDPRLREQRLRGVHAALGAHERRARLRRRRALRPRTGDGGRQRHRGGPRRPSRPFSPRLARARGRCSSSASHTGCAATTRATRSTTGRRSPPRNGRRWTRSPASSERGLDDGWLDEDAPSELEEAARAEVEAAVELARESPYPSPATTAELVYAS